MSRRSRTCQNCNHCFRTPGYWGATDCLSDIACDIDEHPVNENDRCDDFEWSDCNVFDSNSRHNPFSSYYDY